MSGQTGLTLTFGRAAAGLTVASNLALLAFNHATGVLPTHGPEYIPGVLNYLGMATASVAFFCFHAPASYSRHYYSTSLPRETDLPEIARHRAGLDRDVRSHFRLGYFSSVFMAVPAVASLFNFPTAIFAGIGATALAVALDAGRESTEHRINDQIAALQGAIPAAPAVN